MIDLLYFLIKSKKKKNCVYFWSYLIDMFHIDIYFKRGDHGFEPRLGKTKDYKIAKLVLKRGAFLWSNYLTTSIETKVAI